MFVQEARNVKKQRIIPIFLALWMALQIAVGSAIANGSPVSLYLSWLPGITNWADGRAASGSALVSVSLGELKLNVESLPHLTTGMYEAWLVTEDMQEMVSMGRFNSDMLGQARHEFVREDLPARDYRYLLISVEPQPDSDPDSSGVWAIGGVFPDTALLVVTATPPAGTGTREAGTAGPGLTPTPPPPQALPVTGGEGTTPYGGVLVAGLALALFGTVWHVRRRWMT